jgi:hypothetical protein
MFLQKVWRAKTPQTPVQHTHMILRRTLNRHGRSPAGHTLTEAELEKTIAKSWSRETSDDPRRWSCDNPARGQCAVTALIVQDFFGGDLLHGYINWTPHYWNLLPNRFELDLTKNQFKEVVFSGTPTQSSRQFILSNSTTRRNYKRLRKLVLAALHGKRPTLVPRNETLCCRK